MSRVDEREVFFEECDCGQKHENKFIEGVLLNDGGKREFSAALIEHERKRHVWICFFLNGCEGITESECYLTAHVYLNDSGVCFSIEDGEKSPFYRMYDENLYRVSREEVLSSDGLKEALISEYQRLFKADLEIGSYLLVG